MNEEWQEEIDEHISTINNYGSDVSDAYSGLRWDTPDVDEISDAAGYDYESIDFTDIDEVGKAISDIQDMMFDVENVAERFHDVGNAVEEVAENIKVILTSLEEIKEVMERVPEIEVDNKVTHPEYHHTFDVIAVSQGRGNLGYAWCRDERDHYAKPLSFEFSQLTIKAQEVA